MTNETEMLMRRQRKQRGVRDETWITVAAELKPVPDGTHQAAENARADSE
ncbi:hypothetical protein JQ615_21720 [Bradyrhizobium jicamae]|uniref:Transposase n=1 Tax=Bradyrhizobium jicamae TaxID=280332 RepID=A0ABS5FMK9_9BRAD|nr:hypothetical protein [Bradyrhizobium jicamae]MBR0798013.1 hypothetical protein [Bradyrhizobium jicamae]MBR0934401.1 hypothetical protein [Bradyrhizobium jicamae]